MAIRTAFAALLFLALPAAALAQPDAFGPGDLIEDYGPIADVPGMTPIPEDVAFKVSFDFSKPAEPGETNRSLVSGARFLNMHHKAGVDPANMQLAFVVHGAAVNDVTKAAYYEAKNETQNANLPLIKDLLANNVRIIVCGQSAAYYGVKTSDLAPGVEMALSAMTAHALLQQAGYTVNPF